MPQTLTLGTRFAQFQEELNFFKKMIHLQLTLGKLKNKVMIKTEERDFLKH